MPPARAHRWVTWARAHLAEVYAVGLALLTLLFLRLEGLSYGWSTVAYVFSRQLIQFPLLFVEGIALQAAAAFLRRESPRDYLSRVFRARWLAGWLGLWLAATLVLYAYVWLKVSIPLVRDVLYDLELWRIDRWLHFGISPSVFSIELAAGTPLTAILDRWYGLWLFTIPIYFAYALAAADEQVRRNFLFANCLLWSAGVWIYYLVPALGPCYATPDILDPIREEMPRAMAAQQALLANYGLIVGSRGGLLSWFHPEMGVAALPSLHVASHWLFALWARRYDPRLQVPWAVSTLLIFFGSLVSGWHYAIDGYLGLLLAWAAVRIADRVQPVARPGTAPAPAAGPGGAAS